jgi:hypothetical protein
MTERTTLDLATPPRRPPLFAMFYRVYLVMLLIPIVLLAILLWVGVPWARELLKDFKVTLPLVTEFWLVAADFAKSPFLWLPILAAAALLPWPIALHTARQSSPIRQVKIALFWMLLELLMIVVLLSYYMVAIMLPIHNLVRNISGE